MDKNLKIKMEVLGVCLHPGYSRCDVSESFNPLTIALPIVRGSLVVL